MNSIFTEFQKLANLKVVMDQRESASDTAYNGGNNEEEEGELGASMAREEAKPATVVNDFWTGVVESIGKHFQVKKTGEMVLNKIGCDCVLVFLWCSSGVPKFVA